MQTADNYFIILHTFCNDNGDACTAAQTNLAACRTAFSNETDTDAICMGTCQDLVDAIINNCDASVSQVI